MAGKKRDWGPIHSYMAFYGLTIETFYVRNMVGGRLKNTQMSDSWLFRIEPTSGQTIHDVFSVLISMHAEGVNQNTLK